jgi:hypothetical protein
MQKLHGPKPFQGVTFVTKAPYVPNKELARSHIFGTRSNACAG